MSGKVINVRRESIRKILFKKKGNTRLNNLMNTCINAMDVLKLIKL